MGTAMMPAVGLRFLLLSWAACTHFGRRLGCSAGRSLPIGFLAPCSLSVAILFSFIFYQIFRAHLATVQTAAPEAEVCRWVLFLGVFACVCTALLSASGLTASPLSTALRIAPMREELVRLGWGTPIAFACLVLASFLSVPSALALQDWLGTDRYALIHLIRASTEVQLTGALLGFVSFGLFEHSFSCFAGRLTRRWASVAAALCVMACGLLVAGIARSSMLDPWLGSLGRDLLSSGAWPPWWEVAGLLVVSGLAFAGYLLLRRWRAGGRWREGTSPDGHGSGRRLTSITSLDLCLWCREGQGMTLALLVQVFWVLLALYGASDTAAGMGIGGSLDRTRFHGSFNYLMPIGWAFFSTLSVSFTFKGAQQIMAAPLSYADIVWSKFQAALAFSAAQWGLCSLLNAVALEQGSLPPGLSVIAALFVLASACAFTAGVLIPVDKRKAHGGFGTMLTSMLALFSLLVGLSMVFVPSHALFSGLRERGFAQVGLCFLLVSLLIAGASRAARSYGLTR
jgi:hypothetical protein